MLPLIIFLCILASFFVTYWITPWLIKYLRRIDVVVQDQHKEGKPLIPVSGGIAVLAGLMAGVMLLIFFTSFLPFAGLTPFFHQESLIFLLSALITIFIISFVGFVDDLLIRKSKASSAGLRQWQKPLLTLAAAIPLMAAKAGQTSLIVPFFDRVEFGILYPLVLIPLGVVGAANMVNLLAGFNGMEAGMGIIYLFSLGMYAYVHERHVAAFIALITFGALLAFYLFNRTPAKILPGDSLTYLLGATLASIAIVGDLEKATLIVSIPFIIEFFLKMRGKFQKTTVGYLRDGAIRSYYSKIYSIPHILTRIGKYTEKQIVFFMFFIHIIFSSMIWIL